MTPEELLLSGLIFLAALLYASVGHAGSSGYQAAMILVGVAPGVMKPSALILNLLVATIGTVRFWRAGQGDLKTFWPLVVGAVPLAYFGGTQSLATGQFNHLLALVLLVAAARLFLPLPKVEPTLRPLPIWLGLIIGAVIGLASGLTATGGGIFLTPLLLLGRFADARRAAALSVAFILATSAAGLLGHAPTVAQLPPALPLWALAAVLGGALGAFLGSKKLAPPHLRRLLGLVLLVAAWKLMVAPATKPSSTPASGSPMRSTAPQSSGSAPLH